MAKITPLSKTTSLLAGSTLVSSASKRLLLLRLTAMQKVSNKSTGAMISGWTMIQMFMEICRSSSTKRSISKAQSGAAVVDRVPIWVAKSVRTLSI